MSLKGEGNEDDPMFTTKHLHCASCAKGIHNMIGFRADQTNWNNFPFKEPGSRMAKLGQGFSKQFTQSQYNFSYYGANGREKDTAEQASFSDNQYQGQNVSSQRKVKKQRPFTAKVNNRNN